MRFKQSLMDLPTPNLPSTPVLELQKKQTFTGGHLQSHR